MAEDKCDHDLSAASRKVIHDVNTHGWHVMKVLGTSENPAWAFSIGLFHSFKHPEILMFGLPLDTMHQVINAVGLQARAGRRIEAGTEVDDLLEGFRCAFKAVEPVWYEPVLGYATWYYKGRAFPTLQCFWPDREHRFPWDPRFDASLISRQPLVFHRDAENARAQNLVVNP